MTRGSGASPGHGDHWLAALEPGDPRLAQAVAVPSDAPQGVKLHRHALTESLDMVQVTAQRALVTAYPEPRATSLVVLRPRELLLWDTRVEGWLVAEHADAGVLTFFATDLVENARSYENAQPEVAFELGALGYKVERAPADAGPSRLRPARKMDERFLPDDYWFEADVRNARPSGSGEVLDLEFHGGLVVPVALRQRSGVTPGERVRGFLWLTGRWPEGHEEEAS